MGLLDIILLIVIGLSALEGLKRGLIKLLVQLGGVIAAFIVASRYGVAFGQTLSGVLKIEDYAAPGVAFPQRRCGGQYPL